MTSIALTAIEQEPDALLEEFVEPTAEELLESEELNLDYDENAASLDSMTQLIAGLDLERQLTAAEQVRLGREKKLYADLREQVRASLRERGITDRDFDEELYWQVVSDLPYEQRRQIPASEEAFWRMFRANLRLVFWVAKRAGPHEGRDERFQDGCIGLIRGVMKYDPARGIRFGTYAGWWISQAIRAGYARSRFVYLPADVGKQLRDRDNAQQKFIREHDREPSELELAKAVGITVAQLRKLYSYDIAVSSLSSSVGADSDAGELVEMIASTDETLDPEASVISSFTRGAVGELMAKVLTPAECQVLRLREGLTGDERTDREGQMPLDKIAEKLGTSSERVRTLIASAYAKLYAAAVDADLR